MNFRSTLILIAGFAASSIATAVPESVMSLQSEWARVNYQLPEKQRPDAYEALAGRADELVAAEPDSAEAHIWAGIIYSTWAGNSGPFGAMKRAKRAKAELEQALQIEPEAMAGSAYTSLGSLLYQLPGMMGGDDEKAEAYLRKGVELNPEGIDSNFFYASFLVERKRYGEARQFLDTAARAPDRPGREVADAGRRHEVAALVERLDELTR